MPFVLYLFFFPFLRHRFGKKEKTENEGIPLVICTKNEFVSLDKFNILFAIVPILWNEQEEETYVEKYWFCIMNISTDDWNFSSILGTLNTEF